MQLKKRLNQTGDTIIEVLIAIGIISLVLTGAYAVTNRNTQSTQNTLERSEAQKLVAGQIEFLRDKGTIPSGSCFGTDGSVLNTAVDCTINAVGSGADYLMSITTTDNVTYTVSATWTSIGSHTTRDSNVTLYYRPQ